jgi:Beta-lactamase enzyme family
VRRRIALLVVLVAVGAAPAAGAGTSQNPWRPDLKSAVDFAKHRKGIIGFAVRTETSFGGYRVKRTMPSASVVKAMILVAYLDLPSVADRKLHHSDHQILDPMIERSDDYATDQVFHHVGFDGLLKLAKRVGMKRFKTEPSCGRACWGRSHIDAEDQSKFFLHIDDFMVARHRKAGMKLLASVIPEQRWGIAQVQPPGWKLYFKGGWGAGTGWVDHQVALLTRGNMRLSVALLTHWDPSHPYGEDTLRRLAKRLLRGLGPNSVVR